MAVLRTVWVDPVTKDALETGMIEEHPVPVFATHGELNGHFKSLTFTAAGTTALVTPPAGSAMVLTDFIVSAEKVAAGTVIFRFTDGTNEVDIMAGITVDAPVNLAFSPRGRWRGWKDARVDIVTTGSNIDGTVSMGYYFIKGTEVLDFVEWDALRG